MLTWVKTETFRWTLIFPVFYFQGVKALQFLSANAFLLSGSLLAQPSDEILGGIAWSTGVKVYSKACQAPFVLMWTITFVLLNKMFVFQIYQTY